MQNELDDLCLSNGENPRYHEWLSKLNIPDEMNFPVTHADIKLFITANPSLDISVHILCLCQQSIYSAGVYGSGRQIIPLLAVALEDTKKSLHRTFIGEGHFLLIKSEFFNYLLYLENCSCVI